MTQNADTCKFAGEMHTLFYYYTLYNYICIYNYSDREK